MLGYSNSVCCDGGVTVVIFSNELPSIFPDFQRVMACEAARMSVMFLCIARKSTSDTR